MCLDSKMISEWRVQRDVERRCLVLIRSTIPFFSGRELLLLQLACWVTKYCWAKGKVVPVLGMKAYKASRSLAMLILNHCSRWR